MKSALNNVLGHARHERPQQPLPAGFSGEVMARIAQASAEHLVPVSRKGLIFAAAAAVVAAAAVSISMTTDGKSSERPSLAVFGASGSGSLFGKR